MSGKGKVSASTNPIIEQLESLLQLLGSSPEYVRLKDRFEFLGFLYLYLVHLKMNRELEEEKLRSEGVDHLGLSIISARVFNAANLLLEFLTAECQVVSAELSMKAPGQEITQEYFNFLSMLVGEQSPNKLFEWIPASSVFNDNGAFQKLLTQSRRLPGDSKKVVLPRLDRVMALPLGAFISLLGQFHDTSLKGGGVNWISDCYRARVQCEALAKTRKQRLTESAVMDASLVTAPNQTRLVFHSAGLPPPDYSYLPREEAEKKLLDYTNRQQLEAAEFEARQQRFEQVVAYNQALADSVADTEQTALLALVANFQDASLRADFEKAKSRIQELEGDIAAVKSSKAVLKGQEEILSAVASLQDGHLQLELERAQEKIKQLESEVVALNNNNKGLILSEAAMRDALLKTAAELDELRQERQPEACEDRATQDPNNQSQGSVLLATQAMLGEQQRLTEELARLRAENEILKLAAINTAGINTLLATMPNLEAMLTALVERPVPGVELVRGDDDLDDSTDNCRNNLLQVTGQGGPELQITGQGPQELQLSQGADGGVNVLVFDPDVLGGVELKLNGRGKAAELATHGTFPTTSSTGGANDNTAGNTSTAGGKKLMFRKQKE